jgi:hypothetical protein
MLAINAAVVLILNAGQQIRGYDGRWLAIIEFEVEHVGGAVVVVIAARARPVCV